MEVRYFGSNLFDEFFDAANDKRIYRPRYVRYGTDKIGFFRIYLDCADFLASVTRMARISLGYENARPLNSN
jgi:hypothetical protein